MKQQSKSLRSTRKDTAEIGIGTMIVFIAAVIVAAVAAAVLISTAGNLERQASQTGQETQDEVSANIFVRDLVGYINTSLDPSQMDSVNMTISLAPGANTVDLEEMSLRWQSGDDLVDLEYAGTSETDCSELSDGFCVIALTDDNQTPQVLQPGDRVNLHLKMASDEGLTTRTEVTLLLIPEVGSPITTGWTTPASYEDRTYVIIR